MKSKILFLLLLLFFVLLISSTESNAYSSQFHPDLRRGQLESLFKYVGTYCVDEFLNNYKVKEITKKLNDSDLKQLRINLEVKAPISFMYGYYYITGNKKYSNAPDLALLAISNFDKNFYALISNKDEIKIITNDTNKPETIKKFVKDWVLVKQNDYDIKNVKYEFIK